MEFTCLFTYYLESRYVCYVTNAALNLGPFYSGHDSRILHVCYLFWTLECMLRIVYG